MTNQTKIAIVGAAGRMGLEIVRCAGENSAVQIAAGVDWEKCPHIGKDLGTLAQDNPLNVIVTTDLTDAFKKADVVVDISLPQATAGVIAAAVETKTPLVCCTTGLDESLQAELSKAAETIPVLYATNLSPGIAVLTSLVKQAVKALGPDYDIELVEMHHRKKVDAPSGTACTLAEAAAEAANLDINKDVVYGRSGNTGMRPQKEIGVHAVRGGGVFGDHTVILASPDERLELGHKAGSRTLFAKGALRAASFLNGKTAGLYKMADVFGLA